VEARVVGGVLLLAALVCDVSRPACGGSATTIVRSLVACDMAPSRAHLAAPTRARAVETAPPDVPPPPAEEPPPGAAPRLPAPSRVVLVTLDGVRWEDVFESGLESGHGSERERGSETQMPNLQRFVRERGVALGGPGCEHDMRASGPNFVSLPGYLEMFTGKATACTHNGCPPVQTNTVVDDARAVANRPGDIAVFASWSTYAYAVAHDRRSIVLSAGARSPTSTAPAALRAKNDAKLRYLLETGAANSGYPGHGDYRPDEHTARIALHYLETVGPRLLVVGLGDADEHAHRGDIPSYRRAVRRADTFLADLDHALGRMGEDGKQTAVLVTTDHGRSHSLRGHGALYPESQRVFVAAFGAGIAHRGVSCAAEPLRLAHLAGAVRSLLAMESEGEDGPLVAELSSPKANERPHGRSPDDVR
jgi:hypothetical protein